MANEWRAYWILIGLLTEENREVAIAFLEALLKSQK